MIKKKSTLMFGISLILATAETITYIIAHNLAQEGK